MSAHKVKLTFDEVLERLADQRYVDANQVLAAALQRTVWLAEWHLPGCLSESQSICLTKDEAIEQALDMASDENGPPYGMRAELKRHGRSNKTPKNGISRLAITTIAKLKLRDLL